LISDCNSSAESDITLVLSGHLTGDARPFWRAFIELQAQLPTNRVVTQIVTHSLNPELADLINLVYAPQVAECEDFEILYAKILQRIDSGDFHGSQGDNTNSVLKNESFRSLICSAHSRASAIRLLDKLPTKKSQVLISYWDLRDSGSTNPNQIIADISLPVDYLYLSYSSDVDIGYSDGWMLAPWELARLFGGFDQFTLDAFSGRNKYFELFTKIGWPRAQKNSCLVNFLANFFERSPYTIAMKFVRETFRSLEGNFNGDNFIRKILRRSLRPIHLILTQPPLTAENSCLVESKHSRTVFPVYLALNIRPLLKYFILLNELRGKVRFLINEDFECASQSGQVINPQQVILIVCKRGNLPLQLLSQSPLPLAAIYQLTNGLVYEYLQDSLGNWVPTIFQPLTNTPKDQMICALSAAERRIDSSLPLLLIPSVEQYIKCVDWLYLNALIKYIVWDELDYVALDCALMGKPYSEFPDLLMVSSQTFSLFPSAGSIGGIRKLLDHASPQSTGDRGYQTNTPLEFPIVSKADNLFEGFDCV
jgi:hypothetical protein